MFRKKTTVVVGNPGIIGFTLPAAAAGNPGKRKGRSYKMATATKKKRKAPSSTGVMKHRKNAGVTHRYGHKHTTTRRKVRKNVGGGGRGFGSTLTNAVFVIAGALFSKLGAQVALGTNNKDVLGYFANAVAGAVLWFGTSKLMRNQAASDGVISGTIVQILLRVLNDYTPFGSYVANLGLGDYQMQSYVTPQVLVDPVNSAEMSLPNGWGPAMLPPAAAGGAPAGMAGLYGNWGGSSLY